MAACNLYLATGFLAVICVLVELDMKSWYRKRLETAVSRKSNGCVEVCGCV